MGDHSNNNSRRPQSSWTSSNQEPIGTGVKKKIVKSQEKRTIYSNDSRHSHEKYRDIESDRQKKEKSYTSESTSSLDFFIEGERMVSELCNLIDTSSTSKSESNHQKQIVKNTNKEDEKSNIPGSSDILLNALDKIVIHDQIPNQIVQLAVEACTDAENIAIAHHNRPCFKNIHSICAKTRSNVQKPDSAVANLHSQGVPWVIKNFIFSFVRILDGWKGVKELLSEKHDTFSRIENKYYSPNIRECFVQWQAVTKEMLTHIYKTFKCLDHGFTMEQKSFTHNYYATNSAGPRNQSQSKFQSVKPQINIPRPINPSPQSFNAIQPPWIQNQNQPSNQGYTESPWQARTSISYKKIPVIPTQNSNNYFSVNDQNEMDIYQRAHYKEAKPRQSWTITNIPDFRSLEGICPTTDHRDIYAQIRHNMDSEIIKAPGPPNSNIHYDLLLRREMEMKSKMIPLSHVEKSLVPNMTSSHEIRNCYLQRNNSCGDTKDENDFFASWGQMVQKEPNDFITHQSHNIQIASNVVSIPNISGPSQYIDHESDEFHEMSKVYMKPGSYKVPIKPDPISSFVPTAPDVVYDNNSNDSIPMKMKIPYTNVTLAPHPKYNLESWPCVMQKRSEDIFNEENKSIPRLGVPYWDLKRTDPLDILNSMSSDRAWEAAKQSAPKLMDIIHDGSKSDTARLYDALGLTNKNEEYQVQVSQPSWEDNFLSKDMTGLWNLDAFEKKEESSINDNISNNLETEDDYGTLEQIREIKESPSKLDHINIKDDIQKKVHAKQKTSGNWYHPKKKKPLSVTVVKKFEEILNQLLQMQEAKFIQDDMDIKIVSSNKFIDYCLYFIIIMKLCSLF